MDGLDFNATVAGIYGPILGFIFFLILCFNNKLSINAFLLVSFYSVYTLTAYNFNLNYKDIYGFFQVLYICVVFCMLLVRPKSASRVNYWPFLIVLFFVVISRFGGSETDATRSALINLLACVTITVLMYLLARRREDFRSFVCFIGDFSLIYCLLAFIEFFENGATFSHKVSATFGSPNFLALFLSIGFICAAYRYNNGLRKNIILIIYFLAIITTESRSGLVVPALYYIVSKGLSFRKIVTLFFLILSFYIIKYMGFAKDKFSGDGDFERMGLNLMSLQMAIDHPFTGVGWGSFPDNFRNYSHVFDILNVPMGTELALATYDSFSTHNDFLRVLSELGWVAFFVFLIILWRSYNSLKYMDNAKDRDLLKVLFLGICFFSLFQNNMFNIYFWFFLFLPLQIKVFGWARQDLRT